MDAGQLLVDLARLAADTASGAGELTLAKDVAQALLHQVGPEKLRELGAYLVAHATANLDAPEVYPVAPDFTTPDVVDETMPAPASAHEGP